MKDLDHTSIDRSRYTSLVTIRIYRDSRGDGTRGVREKMTQSDSCVITQDYRCKIIDAEVRFHLRSPIEVSMLYSIVKASLATDNRCFHVYMVTTSLAAIVLASIDGTSLPSLLRALACTDMLARYR